MYRNVNMFSQKKKPPGTEFYSVPNDFLVFSIFYKYCDCFRPHGFAELVYTTGFLKSVACLKKGFEVSGEAGSFAGDVDDAVYTVGKDLRQCFRVDSVARRVKNDHIRFLGQVIEDLKNVTGDKSAVIKTVEFRILSRCFHGILHDLNTDHFFCHWREELGNRACSAVQVKNFHSTGILDVVSDNIIEHFRCQ